MIAYYALGGGLGHLRRAARILPLLASTLGAAPDTLARSIILTASLHATDERLTMGHEVAQVPRTLAASRKNFGEWLKAFFAARSVTAVVVDAFPLGILGELADPTILPDVPLIHVARLLRFAEYHAAFPGVPRWYRTTLALEPLTPDHEAFLRMCSDDFRVMRLPEPGAQALPTASSRENPLAALRLPGRPLWLVVHAGPPAEVRQLLEFAANEARQEGVTPQWVVVSPRGDLGLEDGVVRLNHIPADEFFPEADRIVTACGFNSMLDAAPYRHKHRFLPFLRRFDDQFQRAEHARAGA